jgi:hypothetical protein
MSSQSREYKEKKSQLKKLHDKAETHSHVADKHAAAAKVAEIAGDGAIREREEFVHRHGRTALGSPFRALAPILATPIDVCIVIPVVGYLLSDWKFPFVVLFALTTVVIIVLSEMGLGAKLTHLHEVREENGGGMPAILLWTGVALGLGCVLPVFAIAQAFASPVLSVALLFCALATLSLILHSAIVFGGRETLKAKKLLVLEWRIRRLSRVRQRQLEKERRHDFSCVRAAVLYEHGLGEWNGVNPSEKIALIPWTRNTRERLRKALGPGTDPIEDFESEATARVGSQRSATEVDELRRE